MPPVSGVRIRLKSYDHGVLDQSADEIVATAKRTGARSAAPAPIPAISHRYTVLRSPHIDNRVRTAFEVRTHKRLLDILEPTQRTIDELMKLELPDGVAVEIKPFGGSIDDSVWAAIRDRAQVSAETPIVKPAQYDAGTAEADLIQRALTVIGSPDRLSEWMQTSIPALSGRTPWSLMDSKGGRKQVETVLGRIEHGVY
jgi:small subunit ribosomal protein S10